MTGSAHQSGELQGEWDAIVVGAGPAGGMTALRLASEGYRTLLVEAKAFPRAKVCGGCVNDRAWRGLARQGVTERLVRGGAVSLESMELVSRGGRVTFPLATMHAVSRSRLDEAIVEVAIEHGARFLCGTTAHVEGLSEDRQGRQVRLELPEGKSRVVGGRVVVCADGLAHASLRRHREFAPTVAARGRVGLGATVEETGGGPPEGMLRMVVAGQGYVGLTRVEGGRLSLAAAVEPELLQSCAGPWQAIEQIMVATGEAFNDAWRDARWVGTPVLTRSSPRVAAERLFLVGDAAGYVEPFTGEGIAWGLQSAELVVPLVARGIAAWDERLCDAWEQTWKRKVAGRQWMCRLLANVLKSPRALGWSMRLCRMVPAVPRAVARTLVQGG